MDETSVNETAQTLEAAASIVAAAAWPLVALIVALAFTLSRRLRLFVSRLPLKRAKLGAAEIELSPDTAKERRVDLEAYRSAVDLDVRLQTDALSVRQQLRDLVASPIQSFFTSIVGEPLEDYRATVHIHDLVLDDSYYQLVDYVPEARGAERVRSQRFGIVGLAFRHEESIARWTASEDLESLMAVADPNDRRQRAIKELIDRWG